MVFSLMEDMVGRMEDEELVEAAPLLTGTLRNRRQEVKMNLIKFIISLDDFDSEISINELVEIGNSRVGLELDKPSVTSGLEELENEGVVKHTSGEKYRIVDRPEIDTFNGLIDPVWEEFSNILSERDPDLDVEFIHDNMEEAFKRFLYEFFKAIFDSSEEMAEYEIDTLETINTERMIKEKISEYNVDKSDLFKSTLEEYINNPGKELRDFTEKAYTGIINYNLLRREEETIKFEIQGENKKLFLDTNILVAILCQTDKFHPLISSTLERAKELDYDLYYIPHTAKELQSFIDGSKYELQEFRGSGGNRDVVDSQFVKDFLRRDVSYSGYVDTVLNNWREELESRGVVEYNEEFEVDIDLYEMAEETIKKIERVKEQKGSSIKAAHKIDHDAKLISLVTGAKEEAENPNVGPFVVSFDRTVTTVGNLKETGSGNEVSLHPRNLLNYILAFSPVEIDEGGRGDVAVALLRSASNFDDTIEVDQYSKLIRPRLGLDEGQEELLARVLEESDKYEDLEKALADNRGDEADEIAIDILSDDSFLRELSDEWSLKERMRQAANTVEEREEEVDKYKRKYENEKELRESLQKLIQQNDGQNVIIQSSPEATAKAASESTSNASAEATAQSIQKFSEEVDNFIDTLELRTKTTIEQSELPTPPEDTSDIERTREWLENVTAGIASGAAVKGGDALLPWAQDLLDVAIEMGGV